MPDVHVVVLAAGKGTRMKSARPKVLHRVAGRPMIDHVLDGRRALSARDRRPSSSAIRPTRVKAALARHRRPHLCGPGATARHRPCPADGRAGARRRDGHARAAVGRRAAAVGRNAARRWSIATQSTGAAATVVTAIVDDPHGYGRIVRSGEQIARIVEERDATPAEREIREINSGIYAFALDGLFDARARHRRRERAARVLPAGSGGDLPRSAGAAVETVTVANPDEIRGINSRAELAEVSRIVRQQKNDELMAAGVTIEDPATTYIDRDVEVGADTIIHPGVSLEGHDDDRRRLRNPQRRRASSNSQHRRSRTILNHCVITDADDRRRRARRAVRAPAHRRATSRERRAGRQLRRAEEDGARRRLEGDAPGVPRRRDDRRRTSTSAPAPSPATTTARRSTRPSIEDGAFVGSDSQLVAPVTVGKGAYVGSGTTVREDVPAGALAVSAGQAAEHRGLGRRRRRSAEVRSQT